VTLYATAPDAPTQLARGKTDENGAFNLNVDQTPADRVLYLVAKGGTPRAAADKSPNDGCPDVDRLPGVLANGYERRIALPRTRTEALDVNRLSRPAERFRRVHQSAGPQV
jgi:hypothetical protein